MPLPHRQQAAAAVREVADVERVERLAEPRQGDRGDLRVLHGRSARLGGRAGMGGFALRRHPGADGLYGYFTSGIRLTTAGGAGTP
ncbi:hypothetical protein Sya03_52740 [Spirilliplanes yamanashiensis]|uniref:Uncharacterized protein n=1 Tax=Spirilliplanes yamanashiensis TaxID=42233 RepID=A0A8J4DL19_9ACTN|nr:hypothetical protein Sya03_52740 [Spirilliplanes yamanashiensis]